MPLPQLGEDVGHDQQADDGGQHAQGQRQAQLPVDRVVAELPRVAELTFADRVATTGGREHTGTLAVAQGLATGGQAVVDASRLRIRDRGGHHSGGRGRR